MILTHHHSFGGNFLTRYIRQTLSDVVPRRIKRLAYMASVLGALIQNRNPDPRLLGPINDLLKLAYTVPGMLLFIHLHEAIWKDAASHQITLSQNTTTLGELKFKELAEVDLWRIGLYFSRHAVGCMRYGSEELMAADVHDLLSVIKNLPCGQTTCANCAHCTFPAFANETPKELITALRVDFREQKLKLRR